MIVHFETAVIRPHAYARSFGAEAGPTGDGHSKGYSMTRTHDPFLHGLGGVGRISGRAPDVAHDEPDAPDGAASPPQARGVLVPYQTFMELRGLRKRVVAALARADGTRAVAAEGLSDGCVEKDKPGDETP